MSVGSATAMIAEAPAATERMGLGEAVEYFLLSASAEGLSPATVRNYSGALERVVRFAQRQRRIYVDELTPALVRAAAEDAKKAGSADHPTNWKGGESTAHTMIAAARAMSKSLLRDGIGVPDLRVVKSPKVPQRVQPRLTRDEFLKLEEQIRRRAFQKGTRRLLVARDMSLLYLLADTGLRAAECCALNVGDVDFEEGTVTVQRGKGGKGRILSVADQDPHEIDGGLTLRTIRTYLFEREQRGLTDEPALWLTPKGQRMAPNGLREALRRLCLDAGLDGNRPPHAFRRGWFSEAYKSEPMALPVLVARMGWTAADGGLMARTYTRGVDLELARTQPRPSLARQWRSVAPPTPAPLAATAPALPESSMAMAGLRDALVAAVQSDPKVREALVQALFGGLK